MNLYLLTRKPPTDEAHTRAKYDVALGFAVAAEWPKQARRLAAEQAGDEGGITWLDARYSTCERIATYVVGKPKARVVLRDFYNG